MARNSKGQTVQTLSLTVKVAVHGDPSAWDWARLMHHGANLDPNESVEVLDLYVEET